MPLTLETNPPLMLDLFAGIGGFSLAGHWAGFRTAQFVEIEDFPQRVLRKNFPGVPIHGDIKTYDATQLVGRIALVTGGFPCQDISEASGSRAVGIHGPRSGLVKELLRIVGECRPLFVVLENSAKVRIRGGAWLLGQLRSLGYAGRGFVVEAADLGADHRRERAFVVAHAHEVGGLSPHALATIRTVAQDAGRFDPTRDQGWPDVFLRPGAEPRWQCRVRGSLLSGPIFLRDKDGVPDRVDRVAALGNAIVPQVAYPFLKAIYDQLKAETNPPVEQTR